MSRQSTKSERVSSWQRIASLIHPNAAINVLFSGLTRQAVFERSSAVPGGMVMDGVGGW
jgi:hypothetical protein